ncbi:relb/stbd replicon stabilization protein (antitoxin to rele/stbe) [hydrocarbon metagenome]|uniref:Relb/stbd replicon stabilization protein (Antitoxin to rele/stbe) n=1 Tax=hydrocarbon metagenome TaxID=938273 RepID=A0A0W8G1B4_9ZZZZ
MSIMSKRATIYLEPDIHRLLKLKAAETSSSISEIVNDLLRAEFLEDAEDIQRIKERINEPTISYETLLKELKDEGRL